MSNLQQQRKRAYLGAFIVIMLILALLGAAWLFESYPNIRFALFIVSGFLAVPVFALLMIGHSAHKDILDATGKGGKKRKLRSR